MDYEARVGLSRLQIRKLANLIRIIFKIHTLKFPILIILNILEKKYGDVLYVAIEPDDWFEKNVMAFLEIEEDMYCIHIRESVYVGAVNGKGDCLGFINHEICHFILIHIFGIGPANINPIYSRSVRAIPEYKSMEWQAKALCGELMIPYERCKKLTFKQIVHRTGSSKEQVNYFLNNVIKNRKCDCSYTFY